jgi:CRISPR system Cascade subunit CasE
MYLSRLILNPRSRRVQREVANPYEMHRTLMRAFPDDLRKGAERVLFRLEPGRNGALSLLVQSWALPDWSFLAEHEFRGYLLPMDEPNPAIKQFELTAAEGQVLAFRLRANPTARRTFQDKKRRVGLYDEEEQLAWLQRKGEQGGFRIVSARTSGQEDAGGKIRRDGESHDLKLATIQFDGMLKVTDPERLGLAVRQGVGSGKAFGFGLLSLARPPG